MRANIKSGAVGIQLHVTYSSTMTQYSPRLIRILEVPDLLLSKLDIDSL